MKRIALRVKFMAMEDVRLTMLLAKRPMAAFAFPGGTADHIR
jgi:hypothetical protein